MSKKEKDKETDIMWVQESMLQYECTGACVFLCVCISRLESFFFFKSFNLCSTEGMADGCVDSPDSSLRVLHGTCGTVVL